MIHWEFIVRTVYISKRGRSDPAYSKRSTRIFLVLLFTPIGFRNWCAIVILLQKSKNNLHKKRGDDEEHGWEDDFLAFFDDDGGAEVAADHVG